MAGAGRSLSPDIKLCRGNPDTELSLGFVLGAVASVSHRQAPDPFGIDLPGLMVVQQVVALVMEEPPPPPGIESDEEDISCM